MLGGGGDGGGGWIGGGMVEKLTVDDEKCLLGPIETYGIIICCFVKIEKIRIRRKEEMPRGR